MSLREGEQIRRVEGRIRMAGGAEVFQRSWVGWAPQRLLVLVHGLGEHSGHYDEMAVWFARRGFAVYALDLRGHGRTPGRPADVADFGFFIDDVGEFVETVRAIHPGFPCCVVGHSMGGLITASWLIERAPSIDRIALSGAALKLAPSVSQSRLLMARVLGRLAPRLRFAANLELEGLSRDPDVIRLYCEDPLVHGRISAGMGLGMIERQQRVFARAGRVDIPILVLHGEEDSLCAAEGSREFFAGLSRDGAEGSALRVYPGLRHEIFNEPEREQVWTDLLGWLDASPGEWSG